MTERSFSFMLDKFPGQIFQTAPWYVSPVKYPCWECANCDPLRRPSIKCEYHVGFDRPCTSKSKHHPEFKEHNEPTSIQLFYDLFFVANLAACTGNHTIKDGSTLRTYIGFFTLIWFTWFTTIIFDVRFAIDSWFMRLNKACSFCVMMAFAMSTVFFDSADQHFGHDARLVSLILMSSRLFLAIQYGVTMLAVKRRHLPRAVVTPFAWSMCTCLAAAMIYLFLAFLTKSGAHDYGYIGWYFVSVTEAAIHLLISHKWDQVMNFNASNIVERMGALTLIIMGEGILGLTESSSFILKNLPRITSATAGLVIAAVLIIYVTWMLYFDHADKLDAPGARISKMSPWCQWWVLLHMPLHTAILVTLEGSTKFIHWWSANEVLDYLQRFSDAIYHAYYSADYNGTEIVGWVDMQLTMLNDTYPVLRAAINTPAFRDTLTALKATSSYQDTDTNNNNNTNNDDSVEIIGKIVETLIDATCNLFDLDINEDVMVDHKLTAIKSAYIDWLIAFFVAAGCVLLLLGVARWVGYREDIEKNKKAAKERNEIEDGGEWAAIALQCLVGVGLAIIGVLGVPKFERQRDRFLGTPWIIPCVLLAFCLVIALDNILYYFPSRTFRLRSSILHPPIAGTSSEDESSENKTTKRCTAEVYRLQRLVRELGGDPTPTSTLPSPPVVRHSKNKSFDSNGSTSGIGVSERGIEERKNLLPQLLSPPASSAWEEFELDRLSVAGSVGARSDVPLLRVGVDGEGGEEV